jgi:hypothetical protein
MILTSGFARLPLVSASPFSRIYMARNSNSGGALSSCKVTDLSQNSRLISASRAVEVAENLAAASIQQRFYSASKILLQKAAVFMGDKFIAKPSSRVHR